MQILAFNMLFVDHVSCIVMRRKSCFMDALKLNFGNVKTTLWGLKKKKKKKGSNLNLGGRRRRVQPSIVGEEEGSKLESRGKKKKGPNLNLRGRRRRVRTRLAGEEEGFELESRGEDDSDKAVYQVYRQVRVQSGGLTRRCQQLLVHPNHQPTTIHIPVHQKYYLK